MSNALYDSHASALAEFNDGPKFNWNFNFSCKANELEYIGIIESKEDAEIWRNPICPPHFYFTHAEYYKDGVEHIINELKRKPSSNRALYSLISQDDISTSGDSPIPSFMTLQCQILENTLYCTCYFRALEVSNFFKTNLEEIRQTLVQIHNAVPYFIEVNLTVFAFRAYKSSGSLALKRPRLEYLTDLKLYMMLKNAANPEKLLTEMLTESRESVTSVSSKKLVMLKSVIADYANDTPEFKNFAKHLFLQKLDSAIHYSCTLEELRCKQSHGDAVETATTNYTNAINEIIDNLNT